MNEAKTLQADEWTFLPTNFGLYVTFGRSIGRSEHDNPHLDVGYL